MGGCRRAAVWGAVGWLGCNWGPGLSRLEAAQTVRMVCYNIEADIDGVTTPRDGLYTVLEAIGEQPFNGTAQPLDLLALEETTSNTTTISPIVDALNTYYGAPQTAPIYALVPVQAQQSGGTTNGNGPNALIYNVNTLQLVLQNGAAEVGVAGTGVSGVPRQVPRYHFQPVGGPAGTDFYVYVSHMKSTATGEVTTDQQERNNEAVAIRADSKQLPATTSLLYMGDFNLSGTTEPAYQTLLASTGSPGQVIDPLNPQNSSETWDKSSAYVGILTQSPTTLNYRDDIQFMSPNVYSSVGVGLHYVAGSYRAFGNNGTTKVGQSVNQSTNTALNTLQGPITSGTALEALTTGSDHLPVVADFLVTTPYQAWRFAHFTAAELSNPAISGDGADPDGDGVVNLLEYALNLDPKIPGVGGLPTGATVTINGSRYLTLTYTQVIAATDLLYTPQVSADLTTWSAGTGNVVPVSVTNRADGLTQQVVVRDAVAMGSGPARFLQLVVTRP